MARREAALDSKNDFYRWCGIYLRAPIGSRRKDKALMRMFELSKTIKQGFIVMDFIGVDTRLGSIILCRSLRKARSFNDFHGIFLRATHSEHVKKNALDGMFRSIKRSKHWFQFMDCLYQYSLTSYDEFYLKEAR